MRDLEDVIRLKFIHKIHRKGETTAVDLSATAGPSASPLDAPSGSTTRQRIEKKAKNLTRKSDRRIARKDIAERGPFGRLTRPGAAARLAQI